MPDSLVTLASHPPGTRRLPRGLLVLVNAIVFLFELTLSPSDLEGLFHVFGIIPARFTHPDWAISAGLPSKIGWVRPDS